ncbi:tetraspanin-33 [Patella vulgata]|uniref:tetraspanin-33 n=1 Tax=Patella vulgata TaxID=6465 RepID=UPI0021807C4F|nr:tetraspanin-33 [Patella vulgata]XP_050399534.1 tetraspanin-33 [Patella vulgata]
MFPNRERSAVSLFHKFFLFFSNCIFLLGGLALTGAGSYVLYLKEKTINTMIDFLFDPSVMIVLIGAIIMFVSFFGLLGSLREITCCLKFYYIILMILLLLEIAAIVIVFVFYYVPSARTTLGLYPEDTLKDAIIKYRDDEDMQNFIDQLQIQLKCCGVSNDDVGYMDWNSNIYFNCTTDTSGPRSPESCSVPFSCCKLVAGQNLDYQCGGGVMRTDSDQSKIYTKGCLKGLEVWLNDNALIIGGVAIGILIPQAFFIYVAKTLTYQIEEQKSKW